ncbi:MAG: tyrosine-type recombinase/integrase, partial [Solirubrobacteraceae bacterium]
MSSPRRQDGRLGPFVDGYRSWLLKAGYAPQTVRGMLKRFGSLGRWMAGEGMEIGQLDIAGIESFLGSLRASDRRRIPTVRALRSTVEFLRDVGVMLPEQPPALTPVEVLVGEYRQWLVAERGLASMTVLRYETLARRFLTGRVSVTDELGVENLTGAEVSRFLLGECGRVSLGSAKGRVAELRSLLRFLHVRGFTAMALAESVPSVAGWRETTIPPTMPGSDIERLLASCDRSRLDGARDFAIVMLLARFGLRSVEISRLELDDLDWRAGELVVRGKARRHDRLPLPGDVGDALAGYLSFRGRRDSRRVFLTLRAPRRPIRADLVGDVVQRICKRASVPHVGPHRLRHTLASELLAHGASLPDISQVLRHRDLATTAIYAKIDRGRLRQVAQPWPGAGR